MDKAGREYWENSWRKNVSLRTAERRQPTLNSYIDRRFHDYFGATFRGTATCGMKLLEVGCAKSAWLPYFAKQFGFKVYGLDYSETGCEQAQQVLAGAGVEGEIICADLFSPPESMLEAFDVVLSFGVVEHYEDTAACIKAFARFLKPDGMMITIIPNLVGLVGSIQKIINRPVYDIHVPLDSNELAEVHDVSGLEVVRCDYFISVNFGVCNLNGIQAGSSRWYIKKIVLSLLAQLSLIVLFIENKMGNFRVNKSTSPYINCVARKKQSAVHLDIA